MKDESSPPRMTPNKPMQRAGHDKLRGRRRVSVVLQQVTNARVLKRTRPVDDGGRQAALIWSFLMQRHTSL
jgi:hypothetical protein